MATPRSMAVGRVYLELLCFWKHPHLVWEMPTIFGGGGTSKQPYVPLERHASLESFSLFFFLPSCFLLTSAFLPVLS